MPGLAIAALTFGHLPAVFIPAGPMTSGLPNDEKAKIRQLFAEGKVGRDELLEAESKSYHGPGTCTFYGTANSNQMLMEIMHEVVDEGEAEDEHVACDMLAGAYLDRTGDLDTVRSIWPSVVAALDWIDRFGDRDGDGFVEYGSRTAKGLVNQCWKDSHDSIFHGRRAHFRPGRRRAAPGSGADG